MQNVVGVVKSYRELIFRRSSSRKLGHGAEEMLHVRVGARGGRKNKTEARSRSMDIARIALRKRRRRKERPPKMRHHEKESRGGAWIQNVITKMDCRRTLFRNG